VNTVEVIQLIKTTLTRRGEGKSMDDPVRVITQYWRMDGTLEFESDPCALTLKVRTETTTNTPMPKLTKYSSEY
jgi:hypothetical protein